MDNLHYKNKAEIKCDDSQQPFAAELHGPDHGDLYMIMCMYAVVI